MNRKQNSKAGSFDKSKRKALKLIEGLPDLLDSFESDHPHWREAIALSFLSGYLTRLKELLDDPEEAEVSWDEPYVQFQYPVEYTGDPDMGFSAQFGELKFSEFSNRDTARTAMSSLLLRCLEVTFLQEIMDVATIHSAEGIHPLITVEQADFLRSIEADEDRENALHSLLLPASFGAGSIEFPEESNGRQFVDEWVEAQLQKIHEPLITIPLTVEGFQMRLITIFEIQPCIIDPIKKKGYYPIIAGVSLQMMEDDPPEGWHEAEWAQLANWSSKDREMVWDHLKAGCDSIFAELGFATKEEYEEVVVTLKATIKVAPGKSVERAVKQAKASLDSLGLVSSITTTIEAGPVELGIDRSPGWKMLFKEVDEAKDNSEKGKALEKLVRVLFNSVPGFEAEVNVRTKTEEIDIWVSNKSQDPPFSKEGAVILAECKKWNKKVGKDEFVLFQEKLRNRGPRCTLGFLISWQGFAKTILSERLRNSKSNPLVALLDRDAIGLGVEAGEFSRVLINAIHEALSQ